MNKLDTYNQFAKSMTITSKLRIKMVDELNNYFKNIPIVKTKGIKKIVKIFLNKKINI